MTKKEKAEFVQRLLIVLESGVEMKSWKQVKAATTALGNALA